MRVAISGEREREREKKREGLSSKRKKEKKRVKKEQTLRPKGATSSTGCASHSIINFVELLLERKASRLHIVTKLPTVSLSDRGFF